MRISDSTVLVTGGAGFIGCHLADALLARGCRVRLLDNLERSTHPDGAPAWIPKDAEFICGSVADVGVLEKALQGVDLVFHQAALTAFYPEAAPYFETCATGVARMYDVIGEHRLRVRKIVVASSIAIYGEGTYRCELHGVQHPEMRLLKQLKRHEWDPKCSVCAEPMQWLRTNEGSDRLPFTPYGIGKYAGELLAMARGKQLQIPTVALRYGVVYGPRQSILNPYCSVATTFATLLVNGRPPVIYEDGRQCRDWIYIDDVVRANLFVFEEERANYQVFNVGTGDARNIRNLADLLAKTLGRSIEPVLRGEFRPGDIRTMVLDVGKLRVLGFEPRVPFEEGIARFVAWFQTLGSVKEYYSMLEERLRTAGELLS